MKCLYKHTHSGTHKFVSSLSLSLGPHTHTFVDSRREQGAIQQEFSCCSSPPSFCSVSGFKLPFSFVSFPPPLHEEVSLE